MDHHSYLIDYLDSVWSNENPDAAASFFARDARIGGLGTDEPLAPQDMVTFVGAVLLLIEQPRWEVPRVISQGNHVSCLMTGYARARRTGKDILLSGQVMLEIKEGLIVEAINHFDMIGLFTQLGLIPENMFEAALADTLAA